jgi:hypothetical protein
MRPIIVSVGPLASASANNIALSQTVSGAGSVVLNGALVTGGVAVLDKPRHVLITNVGNDSGITFTVNGTGFTGNSISETVTGTSGSTVATTLDFATVTSITTSGSTSASGITVGTNGVAGSSWARLDDWAPGLWSIQIDVTGTVNYTVQTTLDDPNDPTNAVAIGSVQWVSSTDSGLVGQSTTKYSTFSGTPRYVRVLLNSGSGTASATILESSNGPV